MFGILNKHIAGNENRDDKLHKLLS